MAISFETPETPKPPKTPKHPKTPRKSVETTTVPVYAHFDPEQSIGVLTIDKTVAASMCAEGLILSAAYLDTPTGPELVAVGTTTPEEVEIDSAAT